MKILFVSRRILTCLVLLSVYVAGIFCGRLDLSGERGITVGTSSKMPVFYVEKKAQEICLTFDISWGRETLPLVLEVLKKHQVPATFFLSSPWAERDTAAVTSICEAGHEIASHGERHLNLSQHSRETVYENIEKASKSLTNLAGPLAPFFRPPNGDYDDLVLDTAKELGFETVIWSIDSLDWKNPGADYMVERVLQRAFPGAIILCHASDSSKQIHEALPRIIEGLRKKGYKLVNLSELARDGVLARRDPR